MNIHVILWINSQVQLLTILLYIILNSEKSQLDSKKMNLFLIPKYELVLNPKINNFLYHICQTEQGKCDLVLADVDEASNYFSQHCKIIIVSSTALTL